MTGGSEYLDLLYDMLQASKDIIETTGICIGSIVKFDGFYLKIHYRNKDQSYEIEKYIDGELIPVETEIVPYSKMRDYASRYDTPVNNQYLVQRDQY